MPPTLRAFTNEDIDYYILAGVAVVNPTGFDNTIVRTGIRLFPQNFNGSPIVGARIWLPDQNWGGGPMSALRYQWAQTFDSGANHGFPNNGGGTFFLRDTQSGRDLFRLGNNGTLFVQQAAYWNGATWVNFGPAVTITTTYTVHTVTAKIGNPGYFTWHINGAPIASFVGNTALTASTTFDTIDHQAAGPSSSGGNFWIAESILGSDDFMPFGMRVWNPRITGASAYGAGNSQQVSGVYTDINETPVSTATAITMDTSGQLATFAMENTPAALASSPFFAARVAAMARRGNSGPQTIRMVLQQAAGLQESADIALNGIGYTTVANQFLLDFNGVPFAPGVVDPSEGGVRARP